MYAPLEDSDGPYIKLINTGEKVHGYCVRGYVQGRILYFLMHLNLSRKQIFLTRHGESEYNVSGQVGGDAPLSKAGRRYAKALSKWFELQREFGKVVLTVTGNLKVKGDYVTQHGSLVNGRPEFRNTAKNQTIWWDPCCP